MDTGIKLSLSKERLRKIKKRVASTLFLYLMIFVLACDLKTPEDWVTPGYYSYLSLVLIDTEYSFEELLADSTTFYSDTLLDTGIDSVIYVKYPVDLSPQAIPDSIFNINMAAVGIDIPDLGVNDPIYILPPPLSLEPIPIDLSFLTTLATFGCLDSAAVAGQTFPGINSSIPGGTFDFGEQLLFKIISITADSGIGITSIENTLPFSISVAEYSLSSGATSFYDTDGAFNNISSDETVIDTFIISSNDPKTFFVDDDLTLQLQSSIPAGQSPQDGACWDLGDSPSLTVDIGYELKNITSIVIDFYGLDDSIIMGQNIPGFEGIEIKKAILSQSTSVDTNMLLIDINNDTPVDFTLDVNFLNLFQEEDGEWDAISKSIVVLTNDSISYLIHEEGKQDFSGSTLVNDNPEEVFENLVSIDSLSFQVRYGMSQANNYEIVVENNTITLGIDIKEVEIRNVNLERIVAITHELEFPVTESPSMAIPDGFTDIELIDFIMEMELFNEIGIPTEIDLDIQGFRGDGSVTVPVEMEIFAPIPSNDYGCGFEETGNTARTVIRSNRLYQVTEYYCDSTDVIPVLISDTLFFDESSNSYFELLNFAPEKINVSGIAKIEGEGILSKGSEIWGTFTLETPLSFIFKKGMTIIPAEPWSLPAIDDPETSEMINASLIDGEFFVEITNESPASGNVSLLISDSTIFPLFLDSLREWEQQEISSAFENINIDIDSALFIPHPSADSLAREVQFFYQDTLQFFVGRLFELNFPAPDSIDNTWGYYIPAFPGIETSSEEIDTTILGWLISDQPRFSTPMITFDVSPFQSATDTIPITFQTTNAITLTSYLNLQFDTGSLSRSKP